jgi:demethylmenaquinone methyltransferase/2-methoxy-6-polyprenyl-1,4-benzoquinol methylase
MKTAGCIQKEEVREFFDRYAASWDDDMIRNEEVIATILDNAGIRKGSKVLDVACGTGVLIGDYLKRGAASVTAIDLSPEMIQIAKSKYPQENVTFLCGDAEEAEPGEDFDTIVIYNALPHFSDPEKLIAHLSRLLKPGGILTVAHGASRAKINACHSGAAGHVSAGLMDAEELAVIFGKSLQVTTVISDEKMYQIAGKRQ